MRLTAAEFHWLVGLLEGEGSFTPTMSKRRRRDGLTYVYPMPRIQLDMTDEDTIRRAADLMGARVRGPYIKSRIGHSRLVWQCSIAGSKARALLTCMLPYFGARRRERITEVLGMVPHYICQVRGPVSLEEGRG